MINQSRTSRSMGGWALPAALASGLAASGCGSAHDDAVGRASSRAVAGATPIQGYGGRCLDDSGDGTGNGNTIQLWDCNSTDAQQWTPVGSTLVGPGGKCLDVQGDNQQDGTIVQLWDCNGTAAQDWTFHDDGTITSAGGLCLDVSGYGTANGTRIQIWSCTGGANQTWSTTAGGPPPPPPGQPSPVFYDAFADVSNWALITPSSPDGRGGRYYGENGSQWWTNPSNPNTPIQGLYQYGHGIDLGLAPIGDPATSAWINGQSGGSQYGTPLTTVGAMLNTAATFSQTYGYDEVSVSVPNVPGFSFEATMESWEISGNHAIEMDMMIYTDASGRETLLFQILALPGFGWA